MNHKTKNARSANEIGFTAGPNYVAVSKIVENERTLALDSTVTTSLGRCHRFLLYRAEQLAGRLFGRMSSLVRLTRRQGRWEFEPDVAPATGSGEPEARRRHHGRGREPRRLRLVVPGGPDRRRRVTAAKLKMGLKFADFGATARSGRRLKKPAFLLGKRRTKMVRPE